MIIRKIVNAAFYIIVAFYMVFMIHLLFRFNRILNFDREILRNYNLVPFKTILQYAEGRTSALRDSAFSNIFGNIILFIPCGLYIQVLKKDKALGKSLLIVLVAPIVVEVIQFVFGLGACDIDDVLLNFCGGAIGILVYKLLRMFKTEQRAKTAVTVISLAGGLPAIYWLLFRFGFRL